MSDEAPLRADALRLERGGVAILDGVSVTVEPGERILIRGPSGAGKTSLFNVLGLLEPPDGGSLWVDGVDAAAASERKRAHLRRDAVGVVFQDFQLVPDLTVRENVALPQEHADQRDADWLDELFEALAITDLAERYPPTLSGGEKQRVAAARALANRPAVVLADEPTGQLDPDSAERLLSLLVDVSEATGTALVVVSHDRTLGDRFDRHLRLVDGSLSPTEQS